MSLYDANAKTLVAIDGDVFNNDIIPILEFPRLPHRKCQNSNQSSFLRKAAPAWGRLASPVILRVRIG